MTVGLVRDGFDELADILAAAAGRVQRGSGPRTHAASARLALTDQLTTGGSYDR